VAGERAHATAWRQTLDVPLGSWSAYDYDDVPSEAPQIHVLVTVSRRFGGDARNCGRRPIKGWRLTTREVGKTVDEARWAREKVQAALEEQRNATLGTSLLEMESQTEIEADEDMFSGLTVWTYTTLA